MGYSLEDKALCEALSYAFIDTEIDYAYIASVAKNYPKEHVENLFFNYVALACYFNVISPVPPICYFFNEEQLLLDIEKLKTKQKTILGRLKMSIFRYYLKREFKSEWNALKSLL